MRMVSRVIPGSTFPAGATAVRIGSEAHNCSNACALARSLSCNGGGRLDILLANYLPYHRIQQGILEHAVRDAGRLALEASVPRESRESLIRKGVRYCLAAYVDVHGIPKAKTVPIDHFERMLRGVRAIHGSGGGRSRPRPAGRRARRPSRPGRSYGVAMAIYRGLGPRQPEVPRPTLADVLTHGSVPAGGAGSEDGPSVQPRRRV